MPDEEIEELCKRANKIARARSEAVELIDKQIISLVPSENREAVRNLMRAREELKSSTPTMDTVLKNIA